MACLCGFDLPDIRRKARLEKTMICEIYGDDREAIVRTRSFRHPNRSVRGGDICPFVEVTGVFTDKHFRRKGLCRKLMRELCMDADKQLRILYLYCAYQEPNDWLAKFYASLGFVRQDVPIDGRKPGLMIRFPGVKT